MLPPLSQAAIDLAGLALAHSVWSVSDTGPEELLCPLAFIEGPTEPALMRFEAETQEAAVRQAIDATDELGRRGVGWAFAREAALRNPESGSAVDAIVVEFWTADLPRPVSLIQRFQRAAGPRKFHLGAASVLVDRVLQPDHLATEVLARVRAAVDLHPEVRSLWPEWQAG